MRWWRIKDKEDLEEEAIDETKSQCLVSDPWYKAGRITDGLCKVLEGEVARSEAMDGD